MEFLNVSTILVAGLMVGCELAIAAFVHPTLNKLADAVHRPAASAIARLLGLVMPFWYGLVTLLTLAEVVLDWRQTGNPPTWFVASAILWILAIVFSLIALVPINNRIASWEKSMPPAEWKVDRRQWDVLHRWRTILLTVAFTFLIVGGVGRY